MKRSILSKRTVPPALWWAVVVVLLLVVSFQIRSVWERYTIEREMAGRRVEAEQELTTMQQKRDELADQVQYMTNERGLEEELRQNFDVALPGERVFVLTGTAVEDESAVEAATTTEDKETPWYRFW